MERVRSTKCINISDSPTVLNPQIKAKIEGIERTKPKTMVIGANIAKLVYPFLVSVSDKRRQTENKEIINRQIKMISRRFSEM